MPLAATKVRELSGNGQQKGTTRGQKPISDARARIQDPVVWWSVHVPKESPEPTRGPDPYLNKLRFTFLNNKIFTLHQIEQLLTYQGIKLEWKSRL